MNRDFFEQPLTAQTLTLQPLGELIRRSLDGDREAFGQIVRQYQGLVSGVTFGMTGDYHKSEDLAQETFLIAWKQLAELRDFQKLPQWFCGIARTLVRNDRSQNAARPATVSYDATDITEKPARDAEPLDQVIRRERNHLVAETISKIPERYRVPLVMSIRSGLSTPEIATALDISEDTLYQRISRAKKFLRTELEKQVEHSIRTTGPGEFFSLGVVAALPLMAKLTTGGKVFASAAGLSPAVVSEPALLVPMASVSTGTSCSTGGCSTAGTLSFGAMLQLALSAVVLFAGLLFLVLGVLPGIWLSIRNAPTLAARRFLVLTSLRAHFLFALVCSCLYLKMCLFPYLFSDIYWTFIPYSRLLFEGLPVSMVLGFAVIILLLGVFATLRYRQIVRREMGLDDQSQDKSLRAKGGRFQLEMAFFFWLSTILAIYALTTFTIYWRLCTDLTQNAIAWSDGCGWTPWQSFIHYHGTRYAVVGLLFFMVLVITHARFLAMCKGEETMAAAPPIINSTTPFRTRWLVEWVVSLGVFLLASMVFAFYSSIGGIVPRSPFLFTGWLAFLAMFTAGVAAFNARFPVLRLPATLLSVVCLVTASLVYSWKSAILDWTKSQSYPFHAFFDTAASWPVVLIVMLIGFCLFFAILLTLVLGLLYLRRLATGKPQFFHRKTLTITYGLALAMILLAVPVMHSRFKSEYFGLHLIVRKNVDLSDEHSERLVTLANAMMKRFKSQGPEHISAIGTRGELLLRLGRYDEAIADFSAVLEHDIWRSIRTGEVYRFYAAHHRGVAKLLKGDDAAAIADFDLAAGFLEGFNYYSALPYHRGVARERLGDLQGAVTDYSSAIRLLERFAEPDPIYSAIQRPESGSERTMGDRRLGDVGYELPLDGLKAIRDKLLAELGEESKPE